MNHSTLGSPTVIVIDDEETVRGAIMDILELVDIVAIPASDGSKGVKLLEERAETIKLIMLDLTMPGLSGEETFSSIRQLNKEIPILITSGFSQSEIPLLCQNDPFSEFIQKPFSLDHLIERVEFYLGNST